MLDAPRIIGRGMSFGFRGFIDMTAFVASNVRNIVNMLLLQALLIEGMYMWGGWPMMGAGIACYVGIIYASLFMDAKPGSRVILFFSFVLSLLVIFG